MAVVVSEPSGVVLDTASLHIIVKGSDTDYELRMKKELFAVYSPFYMDSQAERIKMESQSYLKSAKDEADHKQETSAQRKRRKKKRPLLSDKEKKVTELIERMLPALVKKARDCKIFLVGGEDSLILHGNNETCRVFASHLGCGDDFVNLCEDPLEKMDSKKDRRIVLDDGLLAKNHVWSAFVNTMVVHPGEAGVLLRIANNRFVIPSSSRFLMSNFKNFISGLYKSLLVPEKYDLIVLDPPWTNKSVKRKKSYNTFEESELSSFPIHEFSKPGSYICVWVTNNERILSFVEDVLFPIWDVHMVAEWFWMKVTQYGEPVSEIWSSHKKPYERIIIGKVKTSRHQSGTCSNSLAFSLADSEKLESSKSIQFGQDCFVENNESKRGVGAGDSNGIKMDRDETDKSKDSLQPHVPKDFVMVSIPCSLHSKKPPLSDVMAPFLPPNPKCLEMFARNLLPGWTSWGNEVLRHQHEDYFDIT